MATGDQQTAAGGSAVAVAPAVAVRDAEGQTLPGVSVQFAVMSGGGSVDGATATTDGSGVARVGKWTLGPSGEQRLSATVGSLPAVVFQASLVPGTETLEMTIGTAGGSFTINDSAHPYHGLSLSVPSGAFSSSGTWTFHVGEQPSLPPLPAGFQVAGPVLEVGTTQRRSDHLMTLDVPVEQAAGSAVVVAFRDPVRGAMEFLPIVARTEHSVRIVTAHLHAGLLLGPGAPPTLIGGGGLRGPQSIGQLIPIRIPLPMPAVASVINAATDRWPVLEDGSYWAPDGHGPAIAAFQAIATADGGARLGTLFPPLTVPGIYSSVGGLAAVVLAQVELESPLQTSIDQYQIALQQVARPGRDQLIHEQMSPRYRSRTTHR